MSERMNCSPMEVNLQSEIDSATSMLFADCKRAELAVYRARLGKFEDASALILLLRQRNRTNPRLQLSIWINLAEGLLAYFQGGGVTAADGVQRAYALSVAAGLTEERALCAAWLAQWDYSTVNIISLTKYVRESLGLASPENHRARARASLVCAQVLHLAGRMDLAHVWYQRTRDHALISRDDATVGALMHNMAWQRMLLLRQLVLTGQGNVEAGRNALTNAESAFRLDKLVGDIGWEKLKPLLRAQILSLQGESAPALQIYNENLTDANLSERWQSNILSDKAWCHAIAGQKDLALISAEMAISSLTSGTQVDDQAATHSRLSSVFGMLGYTERENYHKSQADKLWKDFSLVQIEIVELISKIDINGR
jgi:hypothetical protein